MRTLLISLFALQLLANQKFNLTTTNTILVNSRAVLFAQLGVTENKPNWGFPIQDYLYSVGIKTPAPYCNAGQYYCFWKVTNNIPMVKSGLAISTFQRASKVGVKVPYRAEIDDLIVWNKPKTIFGHIERVVEVGKAGWITTIGFNTTSGNKGNQRDGGGVYKRKRNIYHPLGRNVIKGLVGWKRS